MKKTLATIGCLMACTSLLVGCSEKTVVNPHEEAGKSAFTSQDSILVPNNPETTPEDTSTATESTLIFGEQTYNDSVQVNQKDLGWATYDSVPNDIFLMNFAFFPSDTICQMPDWETEVIDNVAISRKDNNIIAVSIVKMADLPESQALTGELMDLLKDSHGINSFDTTDSEVQEEDYQFWTINKGVLNGQDNMKYILKTYNDGEFGYALYASWDENDIYTDERMDQTLTDIRKTFNLYPLTAEEPAVVEENNEVTE